MLYDMQLDMELGKYLDCFDGVTFWIWKSTELPNMEKHVEKLLSVIGDKPLMLGMYLFDYGTGGIPMNPELFENQLRLYFNYLRQGKTEGIIFCSGTVGDAELETNRILKKYIAQYGETELEN